MDNAFWGSASSQGARHIRATLNSKGDLTMNPYRGLVWCCALVLVGAATGSACAGWDSAWLASGYEPSQPAAQMDPADNGTTASLVCFRRHRCCCGPVRCWLRRCCCKVVTPCAPPPCTLPAYPPPVPFAVPAPTAAVPVVPATPAVPAPASPAPPPPAPVPGASSSFQPAPIPATGVRLDRLASFRKGE
jgi:hypothetical protein